MPWDYKENKPDAVKYLHPKIAKKAIRIANAIVEGGGDEGIAIATGIKKAKGLVKLAMDEYNNDTGLHGGIGNCCIGNDVIDKVAAHIPRVVLEHNAEQFFDHNLPIGKAIAIAISKAKNMGIRKVEEAAPSLKDKIKKFQATQQPKLF